VHRGAFVYGLQLEEVINVTATHAFDPVTILDFEVLPTKSDWNVALVFDPTAPGGASSFFNFSSSGAAPNATQPFDHANPPVKITAMARLVPGWGVTLGSASAPPASPACSAAGADCGPAQVVTLVPYGTTHLRMSVLPWSPP
jgi:hypothetical protein